MYRRLNKRKKSSTSDRVRPVQPDVPPLFCSEPEKNYSQWVANCFPDAKIPREAAIRQWLASPVEVRVQSSRNVQAEVAKPKELPAPAKPSTPVSSTIGPSKTARPIPASATVWNSTLLAPGNDNRFGGRFYSSKQDTSSKLLGRIVKCVAGVVLIALVLWASPTGKGISLANNLIQSIRANEPGKAAPAPASNPPDSPQAGKEVDAESDSAPFTIEDLSVGCGGVQSCVEIGTRGKAPLPKVSTLANPDRVVLDFPEAVPSSSAHSMEVGHDGIKDVRIARNPSEPAYTRVVIDLMEKHDYELRAVANGVELKILPNPASN